MDRAKVFMAGKAKGMGASSEAVGKDFPLLSRETARRTSASKSNGVSNPLPLDPDDLGVMLFNLAGARYLALIHPHLFSAVS